MLKKIQSELRGLANPEKAKALSRFFKTGKGEYGEGDVFLGIAVPEQRRVAKRFRDASLADLHGLLESRVHEHRLVSLLILIEKYNRADLETKKGCADFYLGHLDRINNWDLVDISAPRVLGTFLLDKDKEILYRLAASENLWERRIAILTTLAFIQTDRFDETLRISEMLIHDRHDLIHKAVGWMLREVGKRDQAVEESFLDRHHKTMPRTMLRYAIERFEENKKRLYMRK